MEKTGKQIRRFEFTDFETYDKEPSVNSKHETGKIVVTALIDYDFANKHNQAPYFSITAVEYNRYGISQACGCLHDQIRSIIKRNPGQPHESVVLDLLSWHLVSIDGQPMHYLANAMYWLEQRAFGHFENCIIMGKSPLDVEMADKYQSMSNEEVLAWLEARKPHLKEAFLKAMEAAGLSL